MASHDDLSEKNHQWQQDDQKWSEDIQKWQQLTNQWSALLYLIDKNLPEQTSELEQHRHEIEEHEQKLIRYRCGLDENCIPTCPDHLTREQLDKSYADLATMHQHMHEMHIQLKDNFERKKKTIRELAERLLNLLEDD